ncbi:MAG: serine hydrolase domain-containing protein, partial [Gammaproteobacteria bacterium]
MPRSLSIPCALLLAAFSLPAAAADLYFPPDNDDWSIVAPQDVGWDPELLSAALDVAGERNSSGVVVLHNGRIMAERYWPAPDDAGYRNFVTGHDDDGHAIEDVASAQKSVVAILAGMAQERGYLDLDDPVSRYLGVGWSQATQVQEQAITIEHLLSMTTGLATDFTYAGPAGSRWLYNTPVYHSTMRVLMAATGLERNELTVEWLSN